MADVGHQLTDKELDELEARIYGVYKSAHDDLSEVIADYFAHFEERDKKMLEMVKSGEITEEKYKQWRLAQMGRGERYKELQKKIADRMLNANQTAVAYMNDATPGIYSLNYNYSAYTIEQANEGVDFTLFDEQTVRRLIADEPELWPRPRIDIPADLLWNKNNVRNAITSGILLGESIGKIASRLERVTDMNRNAAIRNARTAVTGAQNAGRQASYERAAEMGIQVRKKWVATIDNRTRHSHAELDGKIVSYNEKFRSILGSEMMYPGDREGKPADIYNCRCTVSTVEKDGIEAEPRMRRVRDPVTGKNVVVQDVTYSEWVKDRQEKAAAAIAEQDKEASDFLKAGGINNLNKVVKRSTIKLQNGFACFPDGDPLNEYAKLVPPLKTYFDVAMHGTPSAVGFGTKEPNMSARVLASVIRHSEGYNGQKIRLLSCNTGKQSGDSYCFAEELSNALGVEVKAPNNLLYIYPSGRIKVGARGEGAMIPFTPNQRRRRK